MTGQNWDGTVSECYNNATVIGHSYAGGLLGGNFKTVVNSYNTGSVSATSGADFVGGLVGWFPSGSVTNCYNSNTVTSPGAVKGGLFGRKYGTVSNCFWNTDFCGLPGVGEGDQSGVTGKNTSEMKTKSTFTNAGWDFATPIWDINATDNNGYPYFAWPTITSFSPSTAGTGTFILITGTNFTGATAVSIGSTAVASFIVQNATSISAKVGYGTTGTISVTTPGGIANSAGTFTYKPAFLTNLVNDYNGESSTYADADRYGQAFTTGSYPRSLSSVDLSIFYGGADAVVKIYSSSAGEMGIEIASLNGTYVSGNIYNFIPTNPITLSANTTYWLVLYSTILNGAASATSYDNTYEPYTGTGTIPETHRVAYSPDGGATWEYNSASDPDPNYSAPFMFALYGDIVPRGWTGWISTDWNNAGNWNMNAVPTASDDISITNATNDPIIGAASVTTESCKNLTIESGAVLTISSGKALTVNGNLVNAADSTGLRINSDADGTGSLKVVGSITGSASIQRYMALDRWYLLSSPTAAQTISDFISKNVDIPVVSTSTSTYGMKDYSTEGTSEWNPYFTTAYLTANSNREMGVGKGYLVRTVSGGTPFKLRFQGTLNSTGSKTISVSRTSTNGWNLIGNPYTSAIKIYDGTEAIETDNFLNVNDGNFDPAFYGAYFWNDATGQKKYDIINKTSAETFAQVGQGFFIRKIADEGVTSMSVTPAMQFHQGAVALKSGTVSHPTIQLIATSGDLKSSTDIKFIDGTSKGLDVGYDAGILKADPSFALYTKLVEPFDADFQLQCLPINQYNNLVIPIGLDSKSAAEIVFTVETVQLAQDCKVILEDKLTHTFTDLSKGSYKAAVVANTSTSERFYLHTGDIVSGLENQVLSEKVTAYARGKKEICIIGEVGEGAVATLFNGLGKVVLTKKLSAGSLNIIGLPNLNSGIYLLKINENGTPQTIKIMIRK